MAKALWKIIFLPLANLSQSEKKQHQYCYPQKTNLWAQIHKYDFSSNICLLKAPAPLQMCTVISLWKSVEPSQHSVGSSIYHLLVIRRCKSFFWLALFLLLHFDPKFLLMNEDYACTWVIQSNLPWYGFLLIIFPKRAETTKKKTTKNVFKLSQVEKKNKQTWKTASPPKPLSKPELSCNLVINYYFEFKPIVWKDFAHEEKGGSESVDPVARVNPVMVRNTFRKCIDWNKLS